MEVVDDHVYLGTIISSNGQRVKDMQDRIKKSKSVGNEIVQICRETELSKICLRYVKLLSSSCLDSKIKYGCALWNVMNNKKTVEDLNRMKPNIIKRVLHLPLSTPSDAIQKEFGINDLSLDIMIEKVILAAETLNREDDRIAKTLLKALMDKDVDGFCTEVKEVCEVLGIGFDELIGEKDVRKKLKQRVIHIQEQEMYKRMMIGSKTDGVLLNGFSYDGRTMKYLVELDLIEARAVFMIRYRMLPTKSNFPGRWPGSSCNICNFNDTDEHIFHCPGYQDIIDDDICYSMFWDDETLNDMDKMKKAACVLLGVIEKVPPG